MGIDVLGGHDGGFGQGSARYRGSLSDHADFIGRGLELEMGWTKSTCARPTHPKSQKRARPVKVFMVVLPISAKIQAAQCGCFR